jgi:C1A family cysteine protease
LERGSVDADAEVARGDGGGHGSPYWTVRNSWSTSWGEYGYCRVQYGINACGIASDATTATIA